MSLGPSGPDDSVEARAGPKREISGTGAPAPRTAAMTASPPAAIVGVMTFNGKAVLVSGATSGIGAATARLFAETGARGRLGAPHGPRRHPPEVAGVILLPSSDAARCITGAALAVDGGHTAVQQPCGPPTQRAPWTL